MSMVLTPRISEKAIGMAEGGVYVFNVPPTANKIEVAKAVEQAFNVKVAAVNLLTVKGKSVRSPGKKRTPGKRSNVKKAMVRLKAGQKIAIFDEGDK